MGMHDASGGKRLSMTGIMSDVVQFGQESSGHEGGPKTKDFMQITGSETIDDIANVFLGEGKVLGVGIVIAGYTMYIIMQTMSEYLGSKSLLLSPPSSSQLKTSKSSFLLQSNICPPILVLQGIDTKVCRTEEVYACPYPGADSRATLYVYAKR